MTDFFEGACIIVDVHIRPEAVRKLFRVRRPLEKGSESQILRDFNTMQLMYDGPRDRCYLNIGRGEKPCGTATSGKVLIGAMERCLTGKHRLSGQLPEGTLVAHKTGTLSNTSSDVGLIHTPDGHVIAVAVYVTGQGSKAARDARIATIARAIFDESQTEGSGLRRSAQR